MHAEQIHTHTHTLSLSLSLSLSLPLSSTHAHAHAHARTRTRAHTHTYQEQGIVKTLIRAHTQALSGGHQFLALHHAPIALQDHAAPLVSFLLLAPSSMYMFRCVHVCAPMQIFAMIIDKNFVYFVSCS